MGVGVAVVLIMTVVMVVVSVVIVTAVVAVLGHFRWLLYPHRVSNK